MNSTDTPLALIVDDNAGDRLAFQTLLKANGYQVTTARSLHEALARVASDPFPDVALLDVFLPDGTGLDLLSSLRNLRPDLPVVMISGQADIPLAVEATRRGAFDFLEKPPRSERILLALRNALERRRLELDRLRLEAENRELRDSCERPHRLIAESPPMVDLLTQVALVAPRRAPAFIQGESGAGKEEIARLLHQHGPAPAGPWVALSVLEVPSELVESALFGHEKGAFTGAVSRHRGVFEQADGGTLFLDEIGEAPTQIQKRLLRVLESGALRRVGGEVEIPIQVRIVTASHRDLSAEVGAGRFRLDLYHRLAVVTLHVPPLRERPEDVSPLTEHFIEQFCKHERMPLRSIAPAAVALLREQDWPGNVRELRNVVERALILTRSDPIAADDVAAVLGTPSRREPAPGAARASETAYALEIAGRATMDEARRALEARHLEEALRATNWNVTRAAERLGLDRTYCHRLIHDHGLKRPTAS
ncbi:MAG: sigma-54 dependent transcriptional regulator [Candidatus Eisenbacteria bacterium]